MLSLDNFDWEQGALNLKDLYQSIVRESIKDLAKPDSGNWEEIFDKFDLDFADLSISLIHIACQDTEINYTSVMASLWKYAKSAHLEEDTTG